MIECNCSLFGLARGRRVLEGEGVAIEVFRGRGVLARMVPMSGLSARFGGDGERGCGVAEPEPPVEVRSGFRQGSVGESLRDGSFSLVSERFLALPNTARLGEVLVSGTSRSLKTSMTWEESSESSERRESVLAMGEGKDGSL